MKRRGRFRAKLGPVAMRKGFALLASAAALAGLGALAPSAGAITFGADLNAASNNTGTCASYSQNSCMHYSGVPGPSFYAPGNGVITSVRVKTANVPQGPMQIVLMRSLFQNNPNVGVIPDAKNFFACCFVQQYGPVFTPAAGGITTVQTSLPTVIDPTPAFGDFTTNARGDFLALSVLAPNVPIPANLDGVPGDPFSGSGYTAYAPAPNASTTPAPSPNPLTGPSAFGSHMMMDAEFSPGGGGGGGGVPQGNPLQFPSGGSLIGSTASIPLTCVLTTACDGLLRLTNQTAGVANASAKVKTFGKKKFSIPAGKTKRIKVKLNKAGKRKARGRKKLALTASATIGSQTVSKRVKLKRK